MAAPPDREAVLNALRVVVDPDLHKDIVSLGFVKDLAVGDGRASFTIELTTPACPHRGACVGPCDVRHPRERVCPK